MGKMVKKMVWMRGIKMGGGGGWRIGGGSNRGKLVGNEGCYKKEKRR